MTNKNINNMEKIKSHREYLLRAVFHIVSLDSSGLLGGIYASEIRQVTGASG